LHFPRVSGMPRHATAWPAFRGGYTGRRATATRTRSALSQINIAAMLGERPNRPFRITAWSNEGLETGRPMTNESLLENPLDGLSATQVRERLDRDGPNELPRQKKRTPWRIALEVLREPMLALLLAAGVTYLLLGDKGEALILLLFACFSILLTVVQEARTENVLEA